MNEIISLLQNHSSVRKFENRPIRAPFTVRTVKGWSYHIQDHLERSILPNMLNHLNAQGYARK